MKVLLLYIFSKNISIESDYLETKMSNFDIRIDQNIQKILTIIFLKSYCDYMHNKIVIKITSSIFHYQVKMISNHSSKPKSPVARRNLLFKWFNTID